MSDGGSARFPTKSRMNSDENRLYSIVARARCKALDPPASYFIDAGCVKDLWSRHDGGLRGNILAQGGRC